MRIELRQIGPRDETKITGGMAICGRPLCCASFLGDFQPVSIKMAKDQNLSLNPTKISGICGRLMCCLKYEEETYEWLNKNLPNIGDIITTPDGKGEVLSVQVLRQTVKVAVKKNPSETVANYYPVESIKVITKKQMPKEERINSAELKEIID
jgi:cell fate regulator YaaT (PSP1 superfamily)